MFLYAQFFLHAIQLPLISWIRLLLDIQCSEHIEQPLLFIWISHSSYFISGAWSIIYAQFDSTNNIYENERTRTKHCVEVRKILFLFTNNPSCRVIELNFIEYSSMFQ